VIEQMSEEKKAFDEWLEPFTCEDTYWKVPTRYMDPSRLDRIYDKIERFEETYKKWTDDLYSGLPSYYCVLCIAKKASAEECKKAYERKKKCSVYSQELIERAYEALSTEINRSTYNTILRLFLKISQALPPNKRREMIEYHDEWLKREKEYATQRYIVEKRGAWLELFRLGAPTFYEVLGVDADSKDEKTGKERVGMNRLRAEISNILANPQLRFEYDYMLDFANETIDEEELEEIEAKRVLWAGKDDLYLFLLTRFDDLKRYEEIKTEHEDWTKYSADKTFYDVLNIDAASIPEDKREAETIIRTAYRDVERTPEVNFAYTILKNAKLRDDYNWLLKNGEWARVVYEFDIEDEAELNAVMEIVNEHQH